MKMMLAAPRTARQRATAKKTGDLRAVGVRASAVATTTVPVAAMAAVRWRLVEEKALALQALARPLGGEVKYGKCGCLQ
jgi:hypothetical protein